MSEHQFRKSTTVILLAAITIFASLASARCASAWSNGGKSASVNNPVYSTHDWIAQHALDWLPAEEKQFIVENLNLYLYGTELPDFADAVGGDGIGDTTNHHVYYHADGTLGGHPGADRAQAMYQEAVDDVRSGDIGSAAKYAGAMTHYIDDLAVFGHVMGTYTDWGAEHHHSDYESYVGNHTLGYDSPYNQYLSFDGTLEQTTAYDVALHVAHDTTFDDSGQGHTAVWMDTHYDWGNPAFVARMGASLNVAVNAVADALHSLWVESGKPVGSPISLVTVLEIVAVLAAVVVIALMVHGRSRHRRRRRRR